MSLVEWPDPAREQELHAALLNNDLQAPFWVAVEFAEPLNRFLLARFPRVDPHLCYSACNEALTNYIVRPARFDPAKGLLGRFLRRSARGDLLNALRKESRHTSNKVEFDVELAEEVRNEKEDELVWEDPRLQACLAELDETERAVIELMRDGERSTTVFAAILGCSDRPQEEQERIVKQTKDRLKKRLQRGVADE